jgi:hypothetical protein
MLILRGKMFQFHDKLADLLVIVTLLAFVGGWTQQGFVFGVLAGVFWFVIFMIVRPKP